MTDFYLLSIETTGKHWSISLFINGRELGSYGFDDKSVVSTHLAPSINMILKEFAVAPSKLSAIAVAAGPGSMTGIRIGMATAIGLASSLNIPCAGVNLLEAMHEALGSSEPDTVAVCSAGRGMLNWQVFKAGSPNSRIYNGSAQHFGEFILTSRTAQIITAPDIEVPGFASATAPSPATLSSVIGNWAFTNREKLTEFPATPLYTSELTFKKLSEQ